MNRSSPAVAALLNPLNHAFEHTYSRDAVFRTVARCDGFALFQATRHADFNRYLLWPAPAEEQDIFVPIDKLVREHRLGNALILSLCDKTTGKWQGLVRLQPFRDGLEFGFHLHPDAWGTWITQSACRTVIQTIVDELPDTPFYIRVRPGNVKMERLCAAYFDVVDRVTDQHATEGEVELNLYQFRLERWERYTKMTTY